MNHKMLVCNYAVMMFNEKSDIDSDKNYIHVSVTFPSATSVHINILKIEQQTLTHKSSTFGYSSNILRQ
jgi:hypothetical protein